MRVVNIVDSAEKINYGIWHAATANAGILAEENIQTELWYPEIDFNGTPHVINIPLPSVDNKTLQNLINKRSLNPQRDIIITHGAWQFPTRWGAWLKKRGFKWIYVPHGMLDPWALRKKRIKKSIYLHLIEKRLAKKADLVKAVSLPESISLQSFFKSSLIRFIPNGVNIYDGELDIQIRQQPRRYLFLSRLHAKKNVIALAAAWTKSRLNNNKDFEFLIAGPDQGELEKLTPYLKQSDNMKYVGSVYDNAKKELLHQCTFYVLPSFSEGLPTALLEAMGYGLIPVITEDCNLPDVFSQNLGVKISTDENNIKSVLEQTACWDMRQVTDTAQKAKQFMSRRYSLQSITEEQVVIFSKLLTAHNSGR